MRRLMIASLLVCPVLVLAQSPEQAPASTTVKPAPRQAELAALIAGASFELTATPQPPR